VTRIVEGTVSILDCRECGRTSPHLIFSGDTDMATMGLASLTSVVADEIVILESEQSECCDKTGRGLEARANRMLSRHDLRFVRLLHAEKIEPSAGQSFQEFREVYRAPNLTYSCPKCGVGEAVAGRSATLSEYRSEGGQFTVFGELELRD